MSNNNMKFFDALVSKTKVYLVIIAILLLLICMLKPICIIPSIIIYAIIVVYTLWTDNKRKAELSERIKELNFNVDKVSKRSLINSPFPLIMAETNGNIIWKNAKFVQEFNNFDINKYLAKLLKEIKLEIENNEKIKDNKVITNIVIEKRKYLTYKIVAKQIDRLKLFYLRIITIRVFYEKEVFIRRGDAYICLRVVFRRNFYRRSGNALLRVKPKAARGKKRFHYFLRQFVN